MARSRQRKYDDAMDVPEPPRIASAQSEAVTVIGGSLESRILLLCDHASNHLPPEYGTLGLPETELSRHIAYDIGAAAVTRALAAQLSCPAVLSRHSRLLIDLNRGADDPTLIMRISDGAVIAGNRHLDGVERARRIARYYAPYHGAIAAIVDQAVAAGTVPVLLSIHSFTPAWKDVPRPWHGAVLWDKDPRLALPLLAALRAEPGLVIGDNEPYSGVLMGDTLWQHGSARGIAHAIVEIRQDLIEMPAGQNAWAGRLARVMGEVLAAPGGGALSLVEHFGSHTGPM